MRAERDALAGALPWVFVLIWSTGFVVARYAMPHSPPMSFLAVRFALSLVLFAAWAALAGVRWPQGRAAWAHLAVSGVLMHAGYLGGVWAAIKHGASAGIVALLVGLQPVLTALWLSAAGAGTGARAVAPRQWGGLLLGLTGLVLVVWRKLGVGEIDATGLALALLALASITVGTLYQKRWVVTGDVRTGSAVQMAAALAVAAPLAWAEAEPMRWHPELIGAMAWSVGVLTLGGSSLLMLLLQRGAATQVVSLLYLVPPCTALLAWALFGELLGPLVLLGLLLAAAGVWLVLRQPPGGPPAPDAPRC